MSYIKKQGLLARIRGINQDVSATIALILGLGVIFLFASILVNQIVTRACFQRLEDAVSQVASNIRVQVAAECRALDTVAELLARQYEASSPDSLRHYLAAFAREDTLCAVGLLLPDGRFLSSGEQELPQEAAFMFSQEAERIPYTSGVITVRHGRQSGRKLIYHAVPFRQNDELRGIIYGFVDLERFADSILVTAFDGNVQVYVADGTSGDFIVDTWHKKLGNIFDASIMRRRVRPGYDFLAMKQDFVEGRSGHIAFWSKTAGEFFYSYYQPVGLNRWMAQISVPESIAFAEAHMIRLPLYGMAALEILIFVAYIAWILLRSRREAAQKKRQIAQARYMYQVQCTLSGAYKNPACLTDALRKVSLAIEAAGSFFLCLEQDAITEEYFHAAEGAQLDRDALLTVLERGKPRLSGGQSLLLWPEELRIFDSDATLARRGIDSLMVVPVLDNDGRLVGMLGCLNMRHHWKDCILLECISRNFQMALHNMRFYRQIERLSMIDMLTGLCNRNSYERYLVAPLAPGGQALACLYMDANGLHEMNNTLGHAAGDAMLVSIGRAICRLFAPDGCYRIGGDEFVVFCAGLSREEVRQRTERLTEELDIFGYHISIGEAWLSDAGSKQGMIALAEQRMYAAKRQYYRQGDGAGTSRLMNQKLERMLREKRDSDMFLSCIAPRFQDVRMVDMDSDTARAMCTGGTASADAPLAALLAQNGGHFLASMEAYVRSHVLPEERDTLRACLDYAGIRRQLKERSTLAFAYRTVDGTRMMLRICRTDCAAETLWLFEDVQGS
ncbi:MAG: diguanylate cyclase [Desulfovibrionaceae bacterium]|nr:diguanylate cyclase [Desulfovibrionaceae bacterium]